MNGLSQKFYKAVWRWHFWMGLLISPVLVVVALTGSLYLFKPQLEPMLMSELFNVAEIAGEKSRLEDFREAVLAEHPERPLGQISINKNPTRTWEGFSRVEVGDGEFENYRFFYDQYEGRFLGGFRSDEGFFATVLTLHRTLFAGTIGRVFVEVATCWGIIAVLSGLLLWIPKSWKKVWGVWLPRIRGSKKDLIRDWHTVPGMYVSVFLLLIMFTGLLFSRIWGTGYLAGNALTGGFPDFYLNHPENAEASDTSVMISADEAYALANEHYDYAGTTHTIEFADAEHPYEVITDIRMPLQGVGVVFIDAFSAEPILVETDETIPFRTHLTLLFYPIHTGIIGGIFTQVLALIACWALVGISLLGIVMWWRRRPQGRLGAPRRSRVEAVPGWVAWSTVGLSVFLPTVGLTMIFVFLGSFVKRRVKPATV